MTLCTCGHPASEHDALTRSCLGRVGALEAPCPCSRFSLPAAVEMERAGGQMLPGLEDR